MLEMWMALNGCMLRHCFLESLVVKWALFSHLAVSGRTHWRCDSLMSHQGGANPDCAETLTLCVVCFKVLFCVLSWSLSTFSIYPHIE